MDERDDLVHEAIGPDLPPIPAAAALSQGAIALIAIGMAPVLLGAMVDEHRLSAAGIGAGAMLELLVMGVSTALAGVFVKPDRLRALGAGAALALAATELATLHTRDINLIVLRGIAGVPEGLMLWITIGMIARTKLPERWAGVFFTSQVLAQLAMALAFAVVIIPKFGGDGAMATLALTALIGVPAAAFLPERYAPMTGHGAGGPPPPRGLAALGATMVFVSAAGAVGIYLQPIAHMANLSSDVARTALWASFAAQAAGGALATLLAGRVNYLTVFAGAGLGLLGVWFAYALGPPAWAFIALSALGGLFAMLIAPFLVPMTIEADPSRRAAMQSGGAQLLGGALGPLLAATVVGGGGVRAVLWLGAALLIAGFLMMSAIHFTAKRAATGS